MSDHLIIRWGGKTVTCPNPDCNWTGPIKDTREVEVSSPQSAWTAMAGREGWEYFCPKCGWMVDSVYTRMS